MTSKLEELHDRALALVDKRGPEFEVAQREYAQALAKSLAAPEQLPAPPTPTSLPPRLIDDSRHSVLKRFSPVRNRWPEVAEFDRRVEELEQRQASLTDELQALSEQHRASVIADKQTLAEWVASENGKRPEPTAPATEQRIEELEANQDALSHAVIGVLDQKAAFVEKHRRRLQRDAAKATEQAAARYEHLLSELEAARTEALEARRSQLWAQLFPSELVTQDVESRLLLGGLRLNEIPWTKDRIEIEQVLAVLRADAAWTRQAQTPAQRAEIEGTDPREGAVWADSPEGEELRRQEAREARERIKKAQQAGDGWEE